MQSQINFEMISKLDSKVINIMTRKKLTLNKYNQILLVDIQNEMDKIDRLICLLQNRIDNETKNCHKERKIPYLFIYFVYPFILSKINEFEDSISVLRKCKKSLRELQQEVFAKVEFYQRKNQARFVLLLEELYVIQRDIGIYSV